MRLTPWRCAYHGDQLDAALRCPVVGRYPVQVLARFRVPTSPPSEREMVAALRCPFACPVCRQPLDWAGGCQACHGTATGRSEDWTMPGDRYEFDDVDGTPHEDGAHWVRILDGPRAVYRPTDAEFAAVRRAVAQIGAGGSDAPATH